MIVQLLQYYIGETRPQVYDAGGVLANSRLGRCAPDPLQLSKASLHQLQDHVGFRQVQAKNEGSIDQYTNGG